MIVFVDTNVLLDVLQIRQPFYASAERVWKLVETGQIEGHVSAISFNNIFYLSRKQSGREAAMDAVRIVRSVFRVVPLDSQIIDEAAICTARDFEDAIQACSSKRVNAEYVITRNVKDFTSLGVAPLTPVEFIALHAPAGSP